MMETTKLVTKDMLRLKRSKKCVKKTVTKINLYS